MATTIKTNFSKETNELLYTKIGDMTKEKKRKVTISEAIETLLKDAYLRKTKASG